MNQRLTPDQLSYWSDYLGMCAPLPLRAYSYCGIWPHELRDTSARRFLVSWARVARCLTLYAGPDEAWTADDLAFVRAVAMPWAAAVPAPTERPPAENAAPLATLCRAAAAAGLPPMTALIVDAEPVPPTVQTMRQWDNALDAELLTALETAWPSRSLEPRRIYYGRGLTINIREPARDWTFRDVPRGALPGPEVYRFATASYWLAELGDRTTNTCAPFISVGCGWTSAHQAANPPYAVWPERWTLDGTQTPRALSFFLGRDCAAQCWRELVLSPQPWDAGTDAEPARDLMQHALAWLAGMGSVPNDGRSYDPPEPVA